MPAEPALVEGAMPTTGPEPPLPGTQETTRIARAAGVLALGNVTSRVLGLARETVKSHFFGASGAVDAYVTAAMVPTMLYDLLIGGMVNGALVPVFSSLAAEDRDELWRLVSALLSLIAVVLAAFVAAVELAAPFIARALLAEATPGVITLAARLLRITIPAVMLLSLSGVLSGLLYALKRFAFPAFTAAVFNATIVALTLIFHQRLGIAAMAFGLLVGAGMQVALQLPGLRDTGVRIGLKLWHPGLRRVAALYAPSLVPLVADVLISRPISIALAVQTGEGGISYLNYATYLVQLPQGLVATAISLAVLPTLSAQAGADGAESAFRRTLARGLRLVLVLIVPAAVGMFILAQPTVALIYGHGSFRPADTVMTTWALRFYLLGLPFAAIDLLLVFSFYARQDTLTPALIGVGTILVYLLLAAGLLPTLGLFSLMIADSVKHMLHTLLSALILSRRVPGLGREGILRALVRVIAAAGVMGAVAYGALKGVDMLFGGAGGLAEVLAVAVPGLAGAGVYLGLVTLLGVDEIRLLWDTVRQRLLPDAGP
jgi:putative peptidoglycan lipid II flippase